MRFCRLALDWLQHSSPRTAYFGYPGFMPRDTEERSAEWYISVLNAISDLILVKGDRSKLLWANRAFLDYYGMTNEQLQDIVDAPHSDPDDTVQYVKDDHRVFTTGRTLEIPSEPITDAHGHVAYFHTIKDAILDSNGNVERTVGISRPITDQDIVDRSRKARTEHKSSLSELRMLVQHMPLAVAMFDAKQRFLCYSEAWLELTGYSGTGLVGEFYDTSHETLIPLRYTLSAALDSGLAQRVDAMTISPPSRAPLIAHIEVRPWSFPNGEIGGTIALVHDITQMKKSERALQQVNEELIQFNYRVSHDLVAPLRTVRGFLNICQGEILRNPDKVMSLHEKMARQIDRLSQLVQDVLSLARADLRDEEYEELSLADLVAEVLDAHSEEIESSSIAVGVDLACTSLVSIRFRVQQILRNLVSNAVKYYDPERRERWLAVSSQRTNGHLTLEVSDNGIGFDGELRDSIFDIFVRGGSKHPGNGLGLYIVRKHAERLGGRAVAASNRNNTIFRVVLPVKEVPQ